MRRHPVLARVRLLMTGIALLVIALIFAFGVGSALGQTTSGDIVGVVKDASGAVIVRADVSITNQETGVVTNLATGSSGEYHASNLPAGKYDVVVRSNGFKQFTLRGVEVELNKSSTSDITLNIGDNTTVEVTADAGAVLDTTSTNLTTSFSNTESTDLPSATIGGASSLGVQSGVLNLSLLSPGVASSGGLGIGSGPSIGGQRPAIITSKLKASITITRLSPDPSSIFLTMRWAASR